LSGIAAVVGVQSGQGLAAKVLDTLAHRGPKMKRLCHLPKVEAGCVGLSSDGTEETATIGSHSIFVDGRIYRFAGNEQVRVFPEELLESFIKEREKAIFPLFGNFTFMILWDEGILLARDPFGLKPLYWGASGSTRYFSSELKGLVSLTEQIHVFPPGYYWYAGKFHKYFTPRYSESENRNAEAAISRLRLLMQQSFERRYRQGAGIFLSGGLDSSIVAAVAASHGLPTFAVGNRGCPDLRCAKEVASHLGLEHYEHVFSEEELVEILPKVIYHLESFDPYLVRSALANYLVAGLAARSGCQVVFCGEGADELFGGYAYLKKFESREELKAELLELTMSGHSGGFQRVDRVTAAHSLEAEMPFMDEEVVRFAFSIPLSWKIHGQDKVEKWILRRAFEKDLPASITWRKKQKFYQGSDTGTVMSALAEKCISDRELTREQRRFNRQFASKEELLYYRIFSEYFPHASCRDTVGRTRTVTA